MNKPHYHGKVTSILPELTVVLGIDLLPNPCSGRGYVIDLTHWSSIVPRSDAVSAAILCAKDARSLSDHLVNGVALIEQAEEETTAGITGVRVLPTITLCGTRFFIDERLRQLRNVENPDHYFDLEDRVWQ